MRIVCDPARVVYTKDLYTRRIRAQVVSLYWLPTCILHPTLSHVEDSISVMGNCDTVYHTLSLFDCRDCDIVFTIHMEQPYFSPNSGYWKRRLEPFPRHPVQL